MKSLGADTTELCAMSGLFLDPWQSHVLDGMMQQRADDKWRTRTGALIVPRQNGKGAVDEAIELGWLLLMDFPVVLHTAHHAKTAKNAFDKMRARIEGSPMLSKRLAGDRSGGIRTANGEWGFTFKSGQKLIYGTRTSGAGRGLTIDALVLDEAQELTDDELEALKPTTGAAPNPFTLWTGSAPKPEQTVLRRMMARGRNAETGICYMEWSVDETLPHIDLDDRGFWAVSNPGYNIRRSEEALIDERMSLSDEGFGREILGIVEVEAGSPFAAGWSSLEDQTSALTGSPTYGLAVAEDRSWACVGAAGGNADGLTHTEYGVYQRGTAWVVDWLAELASRKRVRVAVRPGSQAGSLIAALEARRIDVVTIGQQDYAQACGDFYDSVTDRRDVRHLGQPALDVAVSAAKTRPSGDGFVWDQRRSDTDIAPLEAVTLAAHAYRNKPVKSGRFLAL